MGVLICDKCNEYLPLSPESLDHVCDPEKIKEYVRYLKEEAENNRRKLDDIRNAVFNVLQELPTLEGEKAIVKTDWLRQLWDAAQCQWHEEKTADSFLVRWLVTHRILCEAFDLFESKEKGTFLDKLADLKQACLQAEETLNYGNKDGTSRLDLSPEDIVR